jgi:23S rRNA (adenine2503-C2)-methyltransferase
MSRGATAPREAARLVDLFGMDRRELASALASFTDRPFHAAQLFHQMYGRLETGLPAMTDLPSSLRAKLAERFRISWPRIGSVRPSTDGSKKYLLVLDDGREIESVYIVHGARITLCLSSQVGCALSCRFCLTGTMGLVRNLTPGEILGQIAVMVRDNAIEKATCRIVLMGMGEPLHNYDAVVRAFRIMVDPRGFGLPPRRIVLSTAGLVPGIDRLAKENPRPRLAISLGATDDTLRDDLVPINRKHNLEALLAACRRFPLGPREKITFEYCLIQDVNDREVDARRLARMTRGLQAKVNLIPYNEAGVPGFRTPTLDSARRFRDLLHARGVVATVRWSKGRDVGAACGQLATGAAAV